MPTIAIVLCKYVLAIALVRINFVYLYYLSLCKLVAKVNYNMFQSQTFRMWRRHAAATKNNDGRNYTCVRKTQTNQSCGVSRRHKICHMFTNEIIFPSSCWYYSSKVALTWAKCKSTAALSMCSTNTRAHSVRSTCQCTRHTAV